jgi:hypothetical protein
MKAIEIESKIIKSKTPAEQRVAALKANKDRAVQALRVERANQKAKKARETLTVVNQIKTRKSGGD